jgi:RNA polymerase sigma factor (sigma-70 family)
MTKAPLGAVLRHVRRAAARDTDEVTDTDLLRHFLGGRDAAAFEALVRRHGPMVLRVCRRVLGHYQDAEDAFQVTFLVLARQATSIRSKASLAGWLHGVAYRTALHAKRDEATRRAYEGRVQTMAQKDAPQELGWREVQALLDEEIQALPEAYRAPFVLCQMEGHSREEAAHQLGLKVGTVCSRLGRARERLRQRLLRRGVELPAALGFAALAGGAALAVPRRLLEATARAGAAYAAGDLPGGTLPATAERLLRQALPSAGLTKVKLASAMLLAVLLVVGAAAADGGARSAECGLEAREGPTAPSGNPQSAIRTPPSAAAGRGAAGKATGDEKDRDMTITGRVLTPGGESALKARVAVLLWSQHQPQLGQAMPTPQVLAEGRVDGKGRFRLQVRRLAPLSYYRLRHYQIAVVARADGFGLGFRCVLLDAARPDVEVRLQPEQVRRLRLVDLAGQPVPGVRVEVVVVGTQAPEYHYFPQLDGDETLRLFAGARDGRMVLWDQEIRLWQAPTPVAAWPGPVTSDAQGRFTLHGIGPNQPVTLHLRAASGVACQPMALPARKEDRPPEVTFALAAARVFEGTVTDAQTGAPLPGARVDVIVSAGSGPPWPIPADWRGRQGLVGPHYFPHARPYTHNPVVSVRTDARGRFRINPFLSDYYTVLVTPADGEPYLTVKKSVYWARAAARRTVNVALPRGVPLSGEVREAASGQPVARARLDFWSSKWPLANDLRAELRDGILYPRVVKADARGKFHVVVPAGPYHLLVNAPDPDYVVKKLAVGRLGVQHEDGLPLNMTAGRREGKPHHYYPDEWRTLDFKDGDRPEPLRLTLRRAPRVRGRLVDPDGKPAAARMWVGQEPFAETTQGHYAPKGEVKDGRFELALRNSEAPLCVLFLDAARGLGAAVTFDRKQAGADPVTVRLAPCASATARFVDARGKPLADYRPLLWLSLPARPYSTARELEEIKGSPNIGYDTVWAGHADPRNYGAGPKTDAEGRLTLPNLVPGATYRIALFDGSDRTFQASAGKTVTLGDVTIRDPGKTMKLPITR